MAKFSLKNLPARVSLCPPLLFALAFCVEAHGPSRHPFASISWVVSCPSPPFDSIWLLLVCPIFGACPTLRHRSASICFSKFSEWLLEIPRIVALVLGSYTYQGIERVERECLPERQERGVFEEPSQKAQICPSMRFSVSATAPSRGHRYRTFEIHSQFLILAHALAASKAFAPAAQYAILTAP